MSIIMMMTENCRQRRENKMLQPGAYKADKDGWDGYELTVDIKETEKSLILKIIDYKFRYSPAQIDMLFKTDFDHMSYEEQQNIKNGKYRAVIKKTRWRSRFEVMG